MSTPPDPPEFPPPQDNLPRKVCSNCGHAANSDGQFCEHCGAVLNANEPWPPNQGFVPVPHLPERPDTVLLKYPALDRILGALITGLLSPIYGLGILVGLVVYFNAKAYKFIHQGMLIGCCIWIVVALGAFAWCLYAISGGKTPI